MFEDKKDEEGEVLVIGKYEIPRTITLTYILSILYNSSIFLQYSTIPYLVKDIGLTDNEFGCIQTLFGVFQMTGGLLFGYIIQKFGIRFALFVSYVASCISGIGLFFASDFWSILMFQVPSFLMQGTLTHQTLLSNLTSPGKERTSAFARMGSTLGIGYILVPIFSISATKLFGITAPFIVSSIFSLLLCSIVYNFIHLDINAIEGQIKPHVTVTNICKTMRYPGVFNILMKKNGPIIPFQLVISILNLYMIQKMSATSTQDQIIQGVIGIYIIIANSVGVIYLAKKFNEQHLLIIGSVSFMIGYILLTTIFFNFWMILIIMPFLSLGMSVVATCSDSLLTALVDETEQGIVLGTATSINSLIRTFAPLFAANMLTFYGFESIAFFGIFGSALSILFMLLVPVDESIIKKTNKFDI